MSTSDKHVSKRKRLVISCSECHRRKQKCDRLLPCSNCSSRGKQSLCRYDDCDVDERRSSGGQVSRASQARSSSITSTEASIDASIDSQSSPQSQVEQERLVKDLGYSGHHIFNTLSILRKVGSVDTNQPSMQSIPRQGNKFSDTLSREYWELIRRLPPRSSVDALVDIYFSDVGWQYDVVDEIDFRTLLYEWRNVDYAILQQGPQYLSTDVKFFPALLLQILAQSFLNGPPAKDESFEDLKYAPGMTFTDLAEEYSEAGESVTKLLRRMDTSMVTIQAEFLRIWFLKTIGRVVEAWHGLGSVIRNAQELGLHSEQSITQRLIQHQKPWADVEWSRELARRMWLVLYLWDVHMAVVLGRPILTSPSATELQLPRDFRARQPNMPPIERTATDPPTPFTAILLGYNTAYRHLFVIHEMGGLEATDENHKRVEEIDYAILNGVQALPPWCRLEDPDTVFDNVPGCQWLPIAREALLSEVFLCRLTLHRPYIFTHENSRTAALTAALQILRSQSRLFPSDASAHLMLFTPIFTSFDAMVLATSIYLLYPSGNTDALASSVQSIWWGLNRLKFMGESNDMARNAHGIVLTLYNRLMQRLSALGITRHLSLPSSQIDAIPDETMSARTESVSFQSTPISASDNEIGSGKFGDFGYVDLNGIAPPHPIHDLFFQNLSSIGGIAPNTWSSTFGSTTVFDEQQFEGMLPDDSFWTFMNQTSQ